MALSPSVEIPIVSTAMRAALEDSSVLAVQFDDTCVVIPDPVVQSRMPRLIKKSYSLPLWRRRAASNPPPADALEVAPGPDDRPGVSITVPLPSFSKSRSPSRGEHAHQPLVSCLVNGPTPTPRKHARRPSLPLPPSADAITLPLRPCCHECYPITEECLRDDIAWEERFTRGARRRRNSSAENRQHAHVARHRKVCDAIPGFESVVFADEVDKRRSATFDEPPPPPDDSDVEQQLAPSISRRLQLTPPTSRAVIAEEAEADLFPLPSPSASSSHLPLSAAGDSLPSLPQSTAATAHLRSAHMHTHASTHDPDDDAHRESVYYTPDASPVTPAWLASRESSASGDSDVPLTPSPVVPAAAPAPSKHMPIPPRPRADAAYDSFASFELVDSPPADFAHFTHAGSAPGSPELSASPRRRNFMHMPSLPGPGSFLRAGAEMFKGVGGVPLSV
ncbi:hypothetical protein PsYK624_082770 [Phanerochaete sordida]|uniref:Uncharacterized protein n=1 Tax=Phanerochaete sordida TaxID=48140 RepID=A0A9P3LF07_9APHY|nr:hypothetical protein PsYK624_082770 [Phanerochaete sordida]